MSDADDDGRELGGERCRAERTRSADRKSAQQPLQGESPERQAALESADLLRISEAYVYAAGGDLEAALKLAAQEVATLNARAAALARSVSWGFARRRPPAGFFGGQDPTSWA